jgi:hypothetical protein
MNCSGDDDELPARVLAPQLTKRASVSNLFRLNDRCCQSGLSLYALPKRKKERIEKKNKKKQTFFLFVLFVNVLCVSVYFYFIFIFFCTLANDLKKKG